MFKVYIIPCALVGMEENSFHTLVEIIRIISNANERSSAQVMHELYDEFENFLTENQKIEIKQSYNI